jgi:hypothetical protein
MHRGGAAGGAGSGPRGVLVGNVAALGLEPGRMREVKAEGDRTILLVHTAAGRISAVGPKCTCVARLCSLRMPRVALTACGYDECTDARG